MGLKEIKHMVMITITTVCHYGAWQQGFVRARGRMPNVAEGVEGEGVVQRKLLQLL